MVPSPFGTQIEGGTSSPGSAGAGTAAVDSFIQKVESLSRVFFGLQARALSLWSGGVYNLVLLCSTDEMEAAAAVLRAQKLYYRVLALEALLAKGNLWPSHIRASPRQTTITREPN